MVTPKPLTKSFATFGPGSSSQLLVANWKKYPCKICWQKGYLALAMADRLGYVGFDSNKLTAIAKAIQILLEILCYRFAK